MTVMDSSLESELTAHLHKLSVEIGPRMMGSSADRASAEYIRQVFQNAGLEVEEQRWDCPYWTVDETVLELDGQRLPASANTFSPPCDVSAPMAAVSTMAELASAELNGKIGVLYGDLASVPLTAKGYTIYNPERDQRINALLEAKQPAALLTLEPTSRIYEPLIQDRDLPIPSATVTHEVGLRLLAGIGQIARLKIVSHRQLSSSANIIGRTASSGKPRIVLCAHYDTKRDTPGTVDNGAGSAALLALANRLAKSKTDMEFIAFGGEEYYASGDVEYARRNEGKFGQILAAINMDGIGQRLGSNTITMMSHSEAFRSLAEESVRQYPGIVWTQPWPASNHYTFYSRGVPSIALTSNGLASILHRPTDTIEWVSAAKLAEVMLLVMDIVERIHDKSLHWTRNSI
jgi:hypothetical protein